MTDASEAKLPTPADDPHNVQANKYYIFNQTGNIMFASTSELETEIPESVRSLFAEVSVFFAAMTKAISSTNNPLTGEPYSIYNYLALQKIINRSGLFVHVTQTDYIHTSSSFGIEFSKELLEGLLGLATGAGALSFAQGMLASMGKEGLKIAATNDATDNKVANIVFVCEYLLGMPSISAIVVYCDTHENKATFDFGPCIKTRSSSFDLKMHKDTYLFVTPQFVREYSSDLASVASNADFNEFVDYLQAILTDTPHVIDVFEGDLALLPGATLASGSTYRIAGANLQSVTNVRRSGDTGEPPIITIGERSATSVGFSVSPTAVANEGDDLAAAPLILLDSGDLPLAYTANFKIGPPAAETLMADEAIAKPVIDAPLGFTAGKGVSNTQLISFISAVEADAVSVCDGIIKELKKKKIAAKLVPVNGSYQIICDNNDAAVASLSADQIAVFVDPIVNITITADTEHAPDIIDALNRFFTNWTAVGGLVATGAAVVLGAWLLRVDPVPPASPTE